MAIKGVPVIVVESGGVPVTPVDAFAPVLTVAENGRGTPITITPLGAPFIVQGLWSPASLSPLFWAGSLDPASGRMWQDSAGVTPVTAAGQPVGRMLSSAGAIAAIQPTALSRPTLARWPKGGRRNLLINTPFAGALAGSPGTVPTGWVIGINNASIALPSAEVIEISAAAQRTVIRQSTTVAANEAATFSCNVEVVSGTVAFNQIMDMSIDAGPTYTHFMDGAPVTSTTVVPVGSHVLRVSVANDATERPIAARIGVGFTSNLTAVVRYNQPQFELGATPTPYQKVTTANDITEAGVPDVWHLFDDGGDSLPAVFPAGILHLAYVNQLGAVSYSTAMSDGTTGVDLLLAERMADVIVLDRAFAPDEEAKIEAYWERYAA